MVFVNGLRRLRTAKAVGVAEGIPGDGGSY